jgi:phosphonate ABC transporter permease subunit PhnE
MEKKKISPVLRYLIVFLAVCVAIITYAYGFKVTKVNLDETREERRQTQLVRIIRALAQPDLFEYEKEEFDVSVEILVPCPEGDYTPAVVDKAAPYMTLSPTCAEVGELVMVEGFNFEPNTEGPVNFIPPSGVKLQMGKVTVDNKGHFIMEAKIPKRPDTVAQEIRTTTRRNVGSPHLTQTAFDTWDKIVETVFLALLATTLGTIIAVPLSFFAARNLMQNVTSPLISVALNILAVPIGIFLGMKVTQWLLPLSTMLTGNILITLASVLVGGLIAWQALRWAMPPEELEKPSLGLRLARLAVTLVVAAIAIIVLQLLSSVMIQIGDSLEPRLQGFSFLGRFIADLGDILGIILIVLVALAGGGVMGSAAGKLGKIVSRKLPYAASKAVSILVTMTAGAVLLLLIMAGINWLYQINNPMVTWIIPGSLGALIGLVLAVRLNPRELLPVGISIYFASRTIFNALRSIEALIMVIVFVVWVGIGPFAGVLALGLHTIAALAKLYSEQVESIMEGPIEAITATGANQLQTIVYGVVPQIIPPYISFTMYRWDINVRMSTIIGFAGGGGIGFLLIQNINLLNYRAASAQMLAIALVVASMDYISSEMRKRVV